MKHEAETIIEALEISASELEDMRKLYVKVSLALCTEPGYYMSHAVEEIADSDLSLVGKITCGMAVQNAYVKLTSCLKKMAE